MVRPSWCASMPPGRGAGLRSQRRPVKGEIGVADRDDITRAECRCRHADTIDENAVVAGIVANLYSRGEASR